MAIIKDTDTPIEIILTDELTGLPIDLSLLSGYVVEVFQKHTVFDKFSKNAQAGFRSINETDPANGKFEIYLNAENTKKGNVGKEIFYEVKTVSVDANFDGSTNESSTGQFSLGFLASSALKYKTFV